MLLLSFFILFMYLAQHNGQINYYSDINLFDLGTKFQPVNNIELLSTNFVETLVNCGQCKSSKNSKF